MDDRLLSLAATTVHTGAFKTLALSTAGLLPVEKSTPHHIGMSGSQGPEDETNSTTPALLAKGQWLPHPSLPIELVAAVSKFVQQIPEVHCEEPMDGEQYPWPNIILDRLQDFAFTKGFAVVILSGSQNKGRMQFGCVHHEKPRDTRKIDNPDTALERKGQTTTSAKDCKWAVTCVFREDDLGEQ